MYVRSTQSSDSMNLVANQQTSSVNSLRQYIHVVERWCHIAHQAHQEEWHLQHRIFDEVKATNDVMIPSRVLQICE